MSQLNWCLTFEIRANHGSWLTRYLCSLHILSCSWLQQFWERNWRISLENVILWYRGMINAHSRHAHGVPLLDWHFSMTINIQHVLWTRILHVTFYESSANKWYVMELGISGTSFRAFWCAEYILVMQRSMPPLQQMPHKVISLFSFCLCTYGVYEWAMRIYIHDIPCEICNPQRST